MKALVLFDSQFGNTEKVAQSIASAQGSEEQVEVRKVDQVSQEILDGLEILVVGSPTQRFGMTEATSAFLDGISARALTGVKVAAFDTRFSEEYMKTVPVLRYFVRIAKYAAKPIAKALEKKGGNLVVPPEGFYVMETEGPLGEGEIERAADWGKQIFSA